MYRKSPELTAYLKRVGAEELSFKRFMVKVPDPIRSWYYEERCVIIIDGGRIKVTGACAKQYEPTKEEREGIERSLVNAEFPESVGATRIDDLRDMIGESEAIYEMWDRASDTILMVQQVKRRENGEKYYVPWSLWSDGEWRKMEPDGKLPMWKPRRRTMAARLMIHEGAKAASRAQEIVSDKERHPWMEELSLYEHWGLLGGALAPHRSKYEAINREKFTHVVYFCDNDDPGKQALDKVSRCISEYCDMGLQSIRVGDAFPESWDIADELPPALFRSGRWVGLRLSDMMEPATRATKLVQVRDGKKMVPVLTQAFKNEWVHVIEPDVYIHKDRPDKVRSQKAFNSLVAPFSDVDETDRLVKREIGGMSFELKYDPSKPPGSFSSRRDDGERFFNTHVPSSIRAKRGDASLWEEYLEHVFPVEEDRIELIRWIATLVCIPSTKMKYAVLLISETQGVGKSTLGEEVLGPLIGRRNVSIPNETQIVDNNFNYWQSHVRLAVVNEIYAGHSSAAYNKLKNVITDPTVTVMKKFMDHYKIDNWVHILACSNSLRALRLPDDDRRWLVPKVTEHKKPKQFWDDFYQWIDYGEGLRVIRWWLENWLKKNEPVTPGDVAPSTSIKHQMIVEGYSPGQNLISDVVRAFQDDMNGHEYVILDKDLQALVTDRLHQGRHSDKLEKASTLRKVCERELGMFVSEKTNFKQWGYNIRFICPTRELAEKPASELYENGLDPKKFLEWCRKNEKI